MNTWPHDEFRTKSCHFEIFWKNIITGWDSNPAPLDYTNQFFILSQKSKNFKIQNSEERLTLTIALANKFFQIELNKTKHLLYNPGHWADHKKPSSRWGNYFYAPDWIRNFYLEIFNLEIFLYNSWANFPVILKIEYKNRNFSYNKIKFSPKATLSE